MSLLPTHEVYAELQLAYEHFNVQLFDGQLPDCLITLQRERRTYGYFSRKRFARRSGEMTDEIAMNPGYFAIRSLRKTLSVLAHEMVHLWQFHFGAPGRRGYHNKEWAARMEALGLMPSNTGAPGGKRLGEQVPPNRSNRVKYRCPKCATQVWGKPELAILCGGEHCGGSPFQPVAR
ncbi:SprT-like domain-containing protein [Pseudomonas aeruginosa]|uniref:SprT-like domain-containing protein n=1 Tax=Pseudomonas aeruginosa TaxID=287 RepID=UPI003CC5CC09